MILHDTLLVVYDVTKLVQHCHAKVIEVKKAFRSCDLTSFIEFSRVLEYILMNSMEIYYCTKLVRTVCNSAMQWQHNVFPKVEVQMVALKYIDIS